MSARKCGAWTWQAGLGLALLVGLPGCAPAYDVLASAAGGAKGEGGEGGATIGSGGTGALGGAIAMAGTGTSVAGGSGGFCSGLDCGGANFGGADSGGTGLGGYSAAGVGGYGPVSGGSGGSGALGESCFSHQSCAPNAICRGGFCEACPEPEVSCTGPCANGFEPAAISRNGCQICECAPASDCSSDSDCQNDEICYAGAQCEEGCNDPSCCRGNRCSAPGCTSTAPHCLAAGCAGGGTCLAACDSVSCACNGGSWDCAGSVSTAGAPGSCAQACVAP